MKSLTPPPIPEEVTQRFRSQMETGVPREQLIAEMRSAGLHIIDSINLIRKLYDLPTNEAKQIVHCSKAWADMRESNDCFHDTLVEAARQEGWTVDEQPRETVAQVA